MVLCARWTRGFTQDQVGLSQRSGGCKTTLTLSHVIETQVCVVAHESAVMRMMRRACESESQHVWRLGEYGREVVTTAPTWGARTELSLVTRFLVIGSAAATEAGAEVSREGRT